MYSYLLKHLFLWERFSQWDVGVKRCFQLNRYCQIAFQRKAIITYISTSSILKSSFLCCPSAIGAIALLEACQSDGHKGIPHFSNSHSLMIGEAEHLSVRWLLGNIFAHHPITGIANLSTGIFERVLCMKWMELVMFILNFVTITKTLLLIYLLYVQNLFTYSLFWRIIIAFICM